MPDKIDLDKKNCQFFIAVCMVKGHTMITAGVQHIDKTGESKQTMLLDVGKSIVLEKRKQSMFTILWQMLQGTLDSTIQNERVFVNREEKEKNKNKNPNLKVEYMAYEINYMQYLSLLTNLNDLNPELFAYIPNNDATQDYINLEFAPIKNLTHEKNAGNKDIGAINENKDKLSFTHHCRKTGRTLLKTSFPETSIDDFGVSADIQGHLLCKSSITNGNFDANLVLLPPPPTAYNMGAEETKLLFKLYRRMDKILKLNEKSSLTMDKYEQHKKLYKSIVEQEEPSLNTILSSIITWGDENNKMIDKHRRCFNFFQPTASRKFINETVEQKENNDGTNKYKGK